MSEANKKKWEGLRKKFAKNVVKPAPKGGFGSYVPHHIYTRRLVDSGLPYSFRTLEVIKGTEGYVIAVICELDIDGNVVAETGDVDQSVFERVKRGTQSEGELVKFAVSDAFKRCMMRHGIGLELWEQDLSEEEHQIGVSEDVKPVENQSTAKKEADLETSPNGDSTSNSSIPTASESGTPIANQLNDIIKRMCDGDEDKAKKLKLTAYKEYVAKGHDKNVEMWDNTEIGEYLSLVEQHMSTSEKYPEVLDEKEIVEEVFGEVTEVETKKCPSCNKSGWVEDNRPKKKEEPDRFGRIPDFTCSAYGESNGCGEGYYMGDDRIPGTWL